MMSSRGAVWFERLSSDAQRVQSPASMLVADSVLGDLPIRMIAVVADPNARFTRARGGEVGIDEGYGLGRVVRETPARHAILAIVDVPGQAFGRREEAEGLQEALAAAVEAYAIKRRQGTRIAALIVGNAISGAFLAHGMQAGWIGALRDPRVEVHVMSAAATARVTRMERGEIARLAGEVPATSRDIERFASFGAIDMLFHVGDPDSPSAGDVNAVARGIEAALADPHLGLRAPVERLSSPAALVTRALARDVRARLDRDWNR